MITVRCSCHPVCDCHKCCAPVPFQQGSFRYVVLPLCSATACCPHCPRQQHNKYMLEQDFTHAEAEAVADLSTVPQDDLIVRSEGQGQQEPARPSFLASKRLSLVRRRRSSTNGYDLKLHAMHCQPGVTSCLEHLCVIHL